MVKQTSSPYLQDGRKAIEILYREFDNLKHKFHVETIYNQVDQLLTFPILSYSSLTPGDAIWLLGGVHGEEPAGSNAISKNVKFLNKLAGKGMPIVVMPLLNPLGYYRNWRYPNEARDGSVGTSVGDSEHLLLDLVSKNKARRANPACPESAAISKFVLMKMATHPPKIVIDLHEDEDLRSEATWPYIYSQGELGVHDPLAHIVVDIFNDLNMPLRINGVTRFNEPIVNGIVSITNDGSIDELLATKEIIVDGKMITKPHAKSVLVIETPTICLSLKRRVEAHSTVIRDLEKFYKLKY